MRHARASDAPARRAGALLVLLALFASACGDPQARSSAEDPVADEAATELAIGEGGGTAGRSGPASGGPRTLAGGPSSRSRTVLGGGASSGGVVGTVPNDDFPTFGVSEDEIEVVYYWKGDRTRTSPFLRGTGAEANVDEAEAFRTWIEYINRNPRGELMGFRYDLHGRRLVGTVVDAGSSPEDQASAGEHIAAELQPFAALTAHGSISTYVCPLLAARGITNLGTYDLDFGLIERTRGACIPSGATFDDQARVMQRYLAERVAPTAYDGPSGGPERRIGIVYAEYPGLVDSAPKVIDRMKEAGIPVVAQATVSADLAQAQQQAAGVIAAFQSARVNTIVMPDAGAPLSITAAAEAQRYHPDYVVWPCSGQDSPAMVRLLSATQWERAEGLTCYDPGFMVDLTHDGPAEGTEWYERYRSVGRGEPPAQAPYVYAALLPLVAGITGAGQELTTGRFRAALDAFSSYRYSAFEGRTGASTSMLLALGREGRPLIGDFTVLAWSNAARRSGSRFAGAYVFPEDGKRYGPAARFGG